jgi:hypothetical protein
VLGYLSGWCFSRFFLGSYVCVYIYIYIYIYICCPDKAENPCFLPSTQLLTSQQFQKDILIKNEIKTPNQQIKQPNK